MVDSEGLLRKHLIKKISYDFSHTVAVKCFRAVGFFHLFDRRSDRVRSAIVFNVRKC